MPTVSETNTLSTAEHIIKTVFPACLDKCKTTRLPNLSDTNKTNYNYKQQQHINRYEENNWYMHKLKQMKLEHGLGTSLSSSQTTNWVYSADHLTYRSINQSLSVHKKKHFWLITGNTIPWASCLEYVRNVKRLWITTSRCKSMWNQHIMITTKATMFGCRNYFTLDTVS